jgi:predicted metal-binding membrane protein
MGMPVDAALETALRRDRAIVLGGLVAVAATAWAYILAGAGMAMPEDGSLPMAGPHAMSGMAMMAPATWTPGYALLMLAMWWVMMVAMMLPSAAPMILLFAAVNRKQRERGNPFVPSSVFALGYLAVWAGFSIAAVALQWGLERTALLSPAMSSTSPVLGGLLLLAAGLYQVTPIKGACLRHCRSPLHFIAGHWRKGTGGALVMGLEHGAYCVGCCWFLMGLLFVGGVMNLYWIAGLALFVLLEKTIPAGHWLTYATGLALVLAGGWMLSFAA